MQGFLLFLPVLLVILAAGSANGETVSEVETVLQPAHLQEKAEISLDRETRDAAKKDKTRRRKKKMKGKKSNKGKKKVNQKKAQKKARGRKKNKKDIQKKKKKANSKRRTNKARKKGPTRTAKSKKKKQKRNKNTKPCDKKCRRRRRKLRAKKAKKSKKNGASDNAGKKKKKRRNRARNQQEKKEGKRKRKQMRRKKKKERKMKKAKRKDKKRKQQRGKKPDGRQTDSTTCGTTGVSDTCLINAVEALNFEKNQIQNFFKQKARLLNHNKTTGNKLSKNMNFNESADYMLKAIGGDISNPKCGENTTVRNAAKLDNATKNYQGLNNCSETIKEACSMPDTTIDSAKLETCEEIFTASKKASEDCRTNEAYTSDGDAACTCWEKAAVGITKAKEEKCSTYGSNTAKAVKAQKKKCIQAFSVCKKLQDAAIQLISVCMSGEVNATETETATTASARLF